MKTGDETLDALGQWMASPHVNLRGYPDGTLFLLRTGWGRTYLCKLIGNLDTDISWKAQRLNDFKILRLENMKGALALLLNNAATAGE